MKEIQPVGDEVIRLALDKTAPTYECFRSGCECGRGAESIAAMQETLDKCGIDQESARAYAHGVLCLIVGLRDVEHSLPKNLTQMVTLMVTEALLRAGDITEAQIEEACKRLRERRASGGFLQTRLRQVAGDFGDLHSYPAARDLITNECRRACGW